MTRILIVEDSATQAEQLRLILEAEGFAVQVARDADQALRLFQGPSFDMVVSDIVMPGLSGYELCRRLKADPKGRDVPVILVSTLNDPMDIIHGLECQADNFVVKPYEPELLISRIRTVLDNLRARATGKFKIGVDVMFLGRKFSIASDREHILDLLMSTFEDTVRTNSRLRESKAALSAAKADIERHARELEARVAQRTSELQERQEQLSQAQACARIGDWRWKIADGVLRWSDEMYRIFGVTRQSFTPSFGAVMARVHPDDREDLQRALDRALVSKEPFSTEFAVVRDGGEKRYCWLEGTCQVDEHAEVIAMFGLCRDVTNRKLAEIAAREHGERYRLLVESSPLGIFLLNNDEIIFANPAARALLGAHDQSDIVGKPFLSFVQPEHRGVLSERLAKLLTQEKYSGILEHKLSRVDGSTIEADISLSEFHHDGKRSIRLVARDVTERNTLREQLHQTQKIEAVGQLTGGIAHDFNNLLTVIISNLDLLQSDLADRPESLELADMGMKAALRGAELTSQLLAFSRRQQLQPRSISLNEVARITGMLRRILGERIRIDLRLADGLWLAEADPAQVESALTNLAINARDAMPEGGDLIIETANQTLDADYAADNPDVTPGDYVMLAVSDTGSGIPATLLPHVFEPFFTTKDVGKGTGLGLSMVYGFAKQSGGHVKIYSEEGHGTTVRLYLPRAKAEGLALPQTSPAHATARGTETILVVEDDDDLRSTAVRQLLSFGYSVLQAENGQRALEVLGGEQRIDLLFTDMIMPGMSGADLAREAQRRRAGLRVLFTSGFTDISMRATLPDGAHLLSKPYRSVELAAKIREVLTGEQPAHSALAG